MPVKKSHPHRIPMIRPFTNALSSVFISYPHLPIEKLVRPLGQPVTAFRTIIVGCKVTFASHRVVAGPTTGRANKFRFLWLGFAAGVEGLH